MTLRMSVTLSNESQEATLLVEHGVGLFGAHSEVITEEGEKTRVPERAHMTSPSNDVSPMVVSTTWPIFTLASTTSCIPSNSFFASAVSNVSKYLTFSLSCLLLLLVPRRQFSACFLRPSSTHHVCVQDRLDSSPSAFLVLPTLLDTLSSVALIFLAASLLPLELDAGAALPLLLELLVDVSICVSSGLDSVRVFALSTALS